MKRRSCVPKWIKRGEGKVPEGNFPKGTASLQPMNFKKRDARKKRPAQNKGRFEQGGWALIKARRSGG